MAHYQIMTWHGLPTGVKAEDAGGQVRAKLPRRFQVAVDAVATATGRIEGRAYLKGYQWSEPQDRDGTAREVADAVAAELEETYSPARVKELSRELEHRLTAEVPPD